TERARRSPPPDPTRSRPAGAPRSRGARACGSSFDLSTSGLPDCRIRSGLRPRPAATLRYEVREAILLQPRGCDRGLFRDPAPSQLRLDPAPLGRVCDPLADLERALRVGLRDRGREEIADACDDLLGLAPHPTERRWLVGPEPVSEGRAHRAV